MLLFPNVSGRTMLRSLLPYMLSGIAILAVLAGYLHFTGSVASDVHESQREYFTLLSKNMISVMLDGGRAPVFFQHNDDEDQDFYRMRSEYMGLFGLAEFRLHPLPEGGVRGTALQEDSLAAIALAGMEPVSEYLESGKDDNLLLYYPLQDFRGERALVRIVFENVISGEYLLRYRYSIYLIAAGALLLVLMPGVFLKLAEIRRQIEKTGFYSSGHQLEHENETRTIRSDICPSSLLEGDEFPPVFRLDENGSIMYMNASAESLTDLTRDDVRGSMFHQLSCFEEGDRDGIAYPQGERAEEIELRLVTSSGEKRKAMFNIEKLGPTGYGVSVRHLVGDQPAVSWDVPAEEGQTVPAGPSDELPADLLGRVMAILHEGRVRFRNEESVVDYLGRINDLLARKDDADSSGTEEGSDTIEISAELDGISSALNDVLPDRASIELDLPGFLPEVDCSREDFTQLVKNMVFYSLETNSGPVRIRLGVREVPSPVSDSVFSANCDRSVSRSVSLSYTDGTRIPVVLKEALMDPETDLSGIQRDYGTHISSVAAILSGMECHPVFTEGSMGSTLHILFRISESFLFDQSRGEIPHNLDLSALHIAVCDASKAVRESVSEALVMFGMNVLHASEIDEMKEILAETDADHLVLDTSAVLEPLEEVLDELGRGFPALRIILTSGSPSVEIEVPESMERKVRVLGKPYSVDDLLNIIELTVTGQAMHDNPLNSSGRKV